MSVFPEPGDIIWYNEGYYEISNTTDTQLVAGQPQYLASILCSAFLTRRTSINIEEVDGND